MQKSDFEALKSAMRQITPQKNPDPNLTNLFPENDVMGIIVSDLLVGVDSYDPVEENSELGKIVKGICNTD